jgi:hypothetical protein
MNFVPLCEKIIAPSGHKEKRTPATIIGKQHYLTKLT